MSTDNAWTSEWLKAQQKFVEGWSEMSKGRQQTDSNSQADLWANGLEMWRKTYPAQAETDQVINKCMDIGKGYFAMAEQIGKQIASGGEPDQVVHQWLEQLKTSLQQHADHWSPMQHQATSDLMSPWMAPLATWQKMAVGLMPVQFPTSHDTGWGIGENYEQLNPPLSLPGLGLFREVQEKQQAGIKLMMDYQQANSKFNQSFMRVAIESLHLFQQKIGELSNSETNSVQGSLRGLYDLWVDVSETCYAEYAMSQEYQSLYGGMVNQLMALKKHYSDLADDNLGKLNLPTRREVDTMQQRLQETRRDNRALRRELKEIRALLHDRKSSTGKSTKKKAEPKKAGSSKAATKKSTARSKAGAKA